LVWLPFVIGGALLAGSQSSTFQNAAANAAQYWANLQVQTGSWLYGIPSVLATLVDPCNAGTTGAVLGVGAGAGAYLGRPFWQYYPAGTSAYNSPCVWCGVAGQTASRTTDDKSVFVQLIACISAYEAVCGFCRRGTCVLKYKLLSKVFRAGFIGSRKLLLRD
jgi:hypothetical protein